MIEYSNGYDKCPGIYQIRNIKNNKRYIGLSINMRHRKDYHFGQLKRNKHDNVYLQEAWLNDPEDFTFEIIEYCEVDQLEDHEIYWIKYYNTTNRKHGYNILSGGKHLVGENASWWGKHHTEATKQKMSESARTRPSNRLPKSPEFVEHLRTIFAGQNNPFFGKKHTPESLRIMSEKSTAYQKTHRSPRCMRVVQITKRGDLFCIYDSLKEAARSVNRSYTTISGACSGKQNTCAGYKWMYESDYLALQGEVAS